MIVASLPIPATSLHLIPTFAAQTKLLSLYSSLFCFLTLGFIFYSRHQLARLMFPHYFEPIEGPAPEYYGDMSPDERAHIEEKERRRRIAQRRRQMIRNGWRRFVVALPLIFIAASLVLVFQYNDVLNLSVQGLVNFRVVSTPTGPSTDFKYILEHAELNEIVYSSRLMVLYIAIFLTAEAAFIMMAIKEYLQDLVGLSEMDLILGYRTTPPGQGGAEGKSFDPGTV